MKFICVHGHFYQPPRENPWLEEVELQDQAYPYHDWNHRITEECYAPNTASRLLSPDGRIIDIVSNYSRISFDFGPTLLYWMAKHAPEVYEGILWADGKSAERFSGHGSAMAQIYNHLIMPLANKLDKITQVRWGIRDFEKRFRRLPEGLWLPETAVDIETLDILAMNGIKFTILAPHQASKIRKIGDKEWIDVSDGRIDPRRAYLCQLPSRNSINLFFYDGRISHDVAFGGLLHSGETFAKRLLEGFDETSEPQLVNIATDGETYGHHHRLGDMALAYCLHHIESEGDAKVTNYGEFLEKSPPIFEVKIAENTSWSCTHGIERWRSNCGCNSGKVGWTQEWRIPLRKTADWLRDRLAPLFESETSRYLGNPWAARDDYIDVVLDRSEEAIKGFLSKNARGELSTDDSKRILKLMESQRHAMLMYTSCGWFFDELSGIETVQVMQYAARAIQLVSEVPGVFLEPEYLERVKEAPSNIPAFENGRKIYELFVKPASLDLLKVGGHYAVASLFVTDKQNTSNEPLDVYCYRVTDEVLKRFQAGRARLIVGRSRIGSKITWNEATTSYAALWLGDHNVFAGARMYMGEKAFESMLSKLETSFGKAEVQETIALITKYFGTNTYSLRILFKDEQRRAIETIMKVAIEASEILYRRIFEDNHLAMIFLRDIGQPVPEPLQVSAEIVINLAFQEALASKELDLEELSRLADEVPRLSVNLDADRIGFEASKRIASELSILLDTPQDIERMDKTINALQLLKALPINLNLWRSQNLTFRLGRQNYKTMIRRSEESNAEARRWVELYGKLCELMVMRIPD